MSERGDFAEAVIKAGIKFIGPSPKALYQMGDKVMGKKAALDAGKILHFKNLLRVRRIGHAYRVGLKGPFLKLCNFRIC